jgi:hypothetical protein
MPQPNFVPVIPRLSRNAQSKGVAGSASTSTALPFTFKRVMTTPGNEMGRAVVDRADAGGFSD